MSYLGNLYKIFRGTVAGDNTGTPARTAAQGINDNMDAIDNALATIDAAAEKSANKATDLATPDHITYPTTQAVKTATDAAEGNSNAYTDSQLASRQAVSEKGQANGYAPLDATGLVPAVNLPGSVDEIIEGTYIDSTTFNDGAGSPVTPGSSKIYLDTTSSKQYRWGGSQYTEIKASPGTTNDVVEGTNNLYFTGARVLATLIAGVSTATNAVITAGDSVLIAFGKLQAQITAQATSIGAKLDKSGYTGTAQDLKDLIDTKETPTAAQAKADTAETNAKEYAYTLFQGFNWKDAVTVATTANITLSGEQTIDGVTTSGSRVLVKDQTNATENGIYVSAAGAWSRAQDADTGAELVSATVTASQGAVNEDKIFTCDLDAITLGTTEIYFTEVGVPKQVKTYDPNITGELEVIYIDEPGAAIYIWDDINEVYVNANPKHTATINSIADLKTFTAQDTDSAVELLGYYAKGDGGGGSFYWDAASTEADNGGTIIQVTGVTTGRWKRRFSGAVNVKWFGAKGDGVTDDTVFIQSAIDFLENRSENLYFPANTFLTTQTLEVPFNARFRILGDGGWTYKQSTIKNTTSSVIIKVKGKLTIQYLKVEGDGSNTGISFKRADIADEANDSLNDIDCDVSKSTFQNLSIGMETFGRQVSVYDNQFSQINGNGIIIDKLNETGNYGGSVRAIRIWRNKFHATSQTVSSIWIKAGNAYGCSIQNNFQDSFGGFIKGYLVDSLVSGNKCYHITGYGIDAEIIKNSQITDNNFIQSNKYEDGVTSPPYTALGGIKSKELVSYANISNNILPPSASDCIAFLKGSQFVTIRDNQINRWGISDANVCSAILLDTETSVAKAENVVVEGNKLFQSYVVNSNGITSFSTLDVWVDKNQVKTENGSVVNKINFPNKKPKNSAIDKETLSFKRNISSGENLNDTTKDVVNETGLYYITTDAIADTLTGLPVTDAGCLEVIYDGFRGYRIFKQHQGVGQRVFYQNISGTTLSGWFEMLQKNPSTGDVLGNISFTGTVKALSLLSETAPYNADGTAGSGNGIVTGIHYSQVGTEANYPVPYGTLFTVKRSNSRTIQLYASTTGQFWLRSLHTGSDNVWVQVLSEKLLIETSRTYTGFQSMPTPTSDAHAATKKYVDDKIVVAESLTGTALSLNKQVVDTYNYATPSNATTYTVAAEKVVNGAVRCFINAASEPTVTGGTKISGDAFVANTTMTMVVNTPDGTAIEYYFLAR
jgi:hypothetical protein